MRQPSSHMKSLSLSAKCLHNESATVCAALLVFVPAVPTGSTSGNEYQGDTGEYSDSTGNTSSNETSYGAIENSTNEESTSEYSGDPINWGHDYFLPSGSWAGSTLGAGEGITGSTPGVGDDTAGGTFGAGSTLGVDDQGTTGTTLATPGPVPSAAPETSPNTSSSLQQDPALQYPLFRSSTHRKVVQYTGYICKCDSMLYK
jgi:hypothetical protein